MSAHSQFLVQNFSNNLTYVIVIIDREMLIEWAYYQWLMVRKGDSHFHFVAGCRLLVRPRRKGCTVRCKQCRHVRVNWLPTNRLKLCTQYKIHRWREYDPAVVLKYEYRHCRACDTAYPTAHRACATPSSHQPVPFGTASAFIDCKDRPPMHIGSITFKWISHSWPAAYRR